MEEVTTPSPTKPARKWARAVVYLLAAIGLILTIIIVIGMMQKKGRPDHTFDADETVSDLMTRNYGKYSEAQKGWLFVDDADHTTYIVTVVQQKKIAGKDGDELYLVTSGKPLDASTTGTSFYGVFQLRWTGDQLYQYSSPRTLGAYEPVTPEQVHFEALSADVWGWVVKTVVKEETENASVVTTRNVVLALHDEKIVELAEFNAALDQTGQGDCTETEYHYAEWKKARSERKAAAAARAASSTGDEASEAASAPEEEEGDGEHFDPVRCTKLQWSYRTDPVSDSTFTPLYITRKAGMEEGVQVPAKTWKVMFDPKSFSYLLPDELKVSLGEE
ncbi:hypothetical protein [Pseudoduganella violaceinigra]|uniref:hypothetical protein n=1 Tax=Pseudoduganella violaceinigra TaxID=246602 RepID=UPI00042A10AD|nr:hypothetical protein [Pseudoduganella violaceinigra]